MKNQYVGDINDYRKYGLLRILSGAGRIKNGVCWLLTESDQRNDGNLLDYIDKPKLWRRYDSDLFDVMNNCVKENKNRTVSTIENSGILPSTLFYSKLVPNVIGERHKFFTDMLKYFRKVDLLFFDPDNGIEVTSTPIGRKHSNKYLYWEEFINAYREGHSIIVYQHFTREIRDIFIKRISNEIKEKAGVSKVFTFRTQNVVFFLASQPKHIKYFQKQMNIITNIWESEITCFIL